ncbi:hypothetical protein [Neolewinella agarilytica]|uniref:Uncharacterized protein n=1 Tax=Neolewinella agarilytica TaxID=478744 RepID=A0A1H8ZHV9_9BACT|nr:hypothetical protein [Neolewinella agarilytica]SEP63873.1 hypothetical protein SAMN05444359_101327 [Neolewinella agarilytica]
MKIVFDRDIKGRKIKKGKNYEVISKENESYFILNDDKYPVNVIVKEKESLLLDSETMFCSPDKVEFNIEEIDLEIPPLLPNYLKFDKEYTYADFMLKRCWAVTEFSHKLLAAGIEVCDEFKMIAFKDLAKITYVRAEMSALFLSIGNFFSGCSDDQFHFRFDKHGKRNIGLLELANISFNPYWNGENNVSSLTNLEKWQENLEEKLVQILTINSDFGEHIKKHGFSEEEEWGCCLKRSISRIVRAIDAIAYEGFDAVHRLPLNDFLGNSTFGQYCLIFETKDYYYRFFLGNWD